ncbi:MAG: hypothetical protein H6716_17355 [Polyangiaceae bacterium]|nr:hypothetical protein [Polyangiaceae bacterium]
MRVGWFGVAACVAASWMSGGCGSGGSGGAPSAGGTANGGAGGVGGSAGAALGGNAGAAAGGSSGSAGDAGAGGVAGSGGSAAVGGAGGESCSGTRPCFSGDPQLVDVGLCAAGVQGCSNGVWGACVGEVLPDIEDCGFATDENCDGKQCEVWRKEGLDGSSVAVAANDHVVFGGQFVGTATLGATTLQSHGFSDAWVGSFDTHGALDWVYQTAGADTERVYGLAVAPSGEVSAAIRHYGAVDFGDGSRPSGASLVHLDQAGKFRWSVSVGSASLDWLAVDAAGATYAVGYFDQATTVAGQFVTPQANDALILKLDATGKVLWLKQFGGPGDDYFQGVALAQSGDVVVFGGHTGGTDFGGGPEPNYGDLDNLLLALSPDGEYRHSLVFGSPLTDYGSELMGNRTDTFGLTFWLPADQDFGGEVLSVAQPSSDQIGAARVRLSASGFELDWAGIVPFFSKAAALDPQGNVVVVGDKASQGKVVKLGDQGQTLWSYDPVGLEHIEGAACASTGEVFFGASYSLSTPSTSVEAFAFGKLGK